MVTPKTKNNTSNKTKNVKGKMFRPKTIKSGNPSSALVKNKKAKGEIQKRTQNLSRIAKKVDATEVKDLPEEGKRHQEEGEGKEGVVHPETTH